MLHTHSTIFSRRPPHGEAAPILMDTGAAKKPIPGAAAAIRLACGDHATIEECQTLARAMVDIVDLRNNALLCRPVDGGTRLHLLIEGWAYRAQGLLDGARQITDVLVPGDICDWVSLAPNEEIRASGSVRVAVLHRTMNGQDLQALSARREQTVIGDIQRLRAQLTSLGRRDARGRIAYALADLHRRLERVGLAKSGSFACPLTQEQLGDLLGLDLRSRQSGRARAAPRRNTAVRQASGRDPRPDATACHRWLEGGRGRHARTRPLVLRPVA